MAKTSNASGTRSPADRTPRASTLSSVELSGTSERGERKTSDGEEGRMRTRVRGRREKARREKAMEGEKAVEKVARAEGRKKEAVKGREIALY